MLQCLGKYGEIFGKFKLQETQSCPCWLAFGQWWDVLQPNSTPQPTGVSSPWNHQRSSSRVGIYHSKIWSQEGPANRAGKRSGFIVNNLWETEQCIFCFPPVSYCRAHYPTCCPAKISKRADHSRSFWTSPSSCNWVCCHVVDNSWALNLKQQRFHNKRKQRFHNKKSTAAKGLGCFLALWLIHLSGSFGDGVTGTIMDFLIVWWKKITTKTGIIWQAHLAVEFSQCVCKDRDRSQISRWHCCF